MATPDANRGTDDTRSPAPSSEAATRGSATDEEPESAQSGSSGDRGSWRGVRPETPPAGRLVSALVERRHWE
ncbi:MAG: hypothetical protein J07HR59_00617 [Halorubrum sp. J07HR59]|nr:MAG: hypothetical protein J07HR59_00617 [Halorubrum sp. J07HR59]